MIQGSDDLIKEDFGGNAKSDVDLPETLLNSGNLELPDIVVDNNIISFPSLSKPSSTLKDWVYYLSIR